MACELVEEVMSAADAQPTPVRVRHVPANPSSYAYLDGARWVGGVLRVPDPSTVVACPKYNAWHFGLQGGLPPYAAGFSGGTPHALAAFANRDVIYLQGGNDTCTCAKPNATCACESHGLEVTCADELGGGYRLERGRRYFASLQRFYNRSVHAMHVVPNVGHDHTMIWQSPEGLKALFGEN